ncbi:MAG TPA: hypothetical protein VMY37_39510 [Thermoguttaceae bacterium]|nr:hypothetical protein [Thermoguttaceae bacterium]
MRTLSVWLMLLCVGLFVLGCQPADTSAPPSNVPAPVVGEEEMEVETVEGEEAPAEGEAAAEEAPAEGAKAPEGEAPAEKPAE